MSICPVNSGLFDKTVTVYRRQDGKVIRQVAENCYLSREDILSRDVTGYRKDTKFLLIMPGNTQQVFPGDRVFAGVGPEITPEQWAGFIPVKVEALMEVSFAKPCYWNGELSHVEAGRR